MTPDDYITALKRHDWFYEYSDDHSVWTRGRDQLKALREMRQAHDASGEIWNQYAPDACKVQPTTKA